MPAGVELELQLAAVVAALKSWVGVLPEKRAGSGGSRLLTTAAAAGRGGRAAG